MAKSKGDKILDAVAALSAHGVKFPKILKLSNETFNKSNKDAFFVTECGNVSVNPGPKYPYVSFWNGTVCTFEDATIEETLIYLAGLGAIKDSIQFLPKTTGVSIKEILYG